jgi:NTE family protein
MSEQAAAGENKQVTPVDLVFQGGGVKGIALVGAYSVLEERRYQPVNMAGASAGAIVAALIAAGHSANKLYSVMKGLDLTLFKDRSWEDRIPGFLRYPLSMIKDKGIYEGDEFHRWIKEQLGEELTFGDLRRNDVPKDAPPVYHHKVQVIVSDTTGRRMVVLPRDADKLGWDEPDRIPVALAVRMSMSFPIFFEPVRRLVPADNGVEHLIVDGGMLSNFPVWLFDVPEGQEAKRNTFGLKLIVEDPRKPMVKPGSAPNVLDAEVPEKQKRQTTLEYLLSLVSTMMEAPDRLYIESKKFETTIGIPTLGVGTMDFHLSDETKDALYKSGREKAGEFLNKIESRPSFAETPPASSP